MKNDPVYRLPPFKVVCVAASLSQVEGWNIKKLNVPKTWTVTEGENIKVMVIDTGYTDHSDLVDTMRKDLSKSFLLYEPSINDMNGHSTHCAGIIGANNNSIGMVGVAPKCNIITCKVLDANGTGDLTGICQALEYALRIKPDVISMSLGAGVDIPRMHDIVKELHSLNIPIIAAAGNDGRSNSVNFPGRYEEAICVTAFDINGNPAYFNSTGKEVDISGPGVDIYSTYLNNQYAKLSGSSMATPFIAGTIALLIAKHRKQEKDTGLNDCKTVDQIKEHLIKYSDDKGVIGTDPTWGYGMINPERLIFELNGGDIPKLIYKKTLLQKILEFFGFARR